MPDKPVLFWFRRNLRIGDNPGLAAAAQSNAPVIPFFILDEKAEAATGGASRWWLSRSLAALGKDLQYHESRLILRKGRFSEEIARLATETGAKALYFTRGYEPDIVQLENVLNSDLRDSKIDCKRFGGQLLVEPEHIANASGEPYKVFTPFYKTCLGKETIGEIASTPGKIAAPAEWPDSASLQDWALEPSRPDWASGIRKYWSPGEEAATARLASFIGEALENYAEGRDYPDVDGTSRLSPYLAFGQISPRQVWHAVKHAAHRETGLDSGAKSFIRELYWREFSTHLLYHWPSLPEKPFRPEFAQMPWKKSKKHLNAWQKGKTGYPIVDAGLRQLWAIGWMHNRVRMIAASLLTKHLLIHWREGADWFRDTLVDADLANNSASWQWVAGSGADAAPYFRIFNPVIQGEKFDPKGDYVREWVPELANLPGKHIHAPWNAPEDVCKQAGVTLGKDYPFPIIEHKRGREQALEAYEFVKAAAG
ncbi:MAG: DNA photolyase family protein [Hyphomicrobiales bacterium]|nr:DNA photolyase family protein [Hyphomicrobiales bacterium]